MQLKVNTV